MIDFFSYPATASIYALFSVFAVTLIVSHLVLLPLLGFNEVRWQYIDYVWLPLTILGLAGAVQMNRAEVASNYVTVLNSQAMDALIRLHDMTDRHAETESYLCRKGIRTDYSPPPAIYDAIERDYARTCNWFKILKLNLPKTLKEVPPDFGLNSFPSPPNLSSVSGSGPKEDIEYFRKGVDQVVDAIERIKVHQIEMKPPFFLIMIKYIGPFVIAIALALRITKVSGEIRIKKKKGTP